jgi:hypothetical protein
LLEDGPLNIGLDLACTSREGTHILWDAKLEIAFLAPGGSPGVSDFPVFGAFIDVIFCVLSKTDQSNSVVNGGGLGVGTDTIGFSDHAASVTHETFRVRVHGKTDRLFSN